MTHFDRQLTIDYAAACDRATTNQGLDPVVAALTTAGIDHQVEQTGGFTMVVTAKAPEGTWAMTHEVDTMYVLGFYPGKSWDERHEDDNDDPEYFDLALDEAVAKIAESLR